MNLKSLVTNLAKSLDWRIERCITFASMVISLIDQQTVQHHGLIRFLNPGLANRVDKK